MTGSHSAIAPSPASTSHADRLNRRLAGVLAVHFDEDRGTPFWLDRQRALGIDVRRVVRRIEDLSQLGQMTPDDLAGRPLTDFIPRQFHDQMDRFVVAQTGGTTGPGVWTAYLEHEFAEAFVTPFVVAAMHVGFPTREPWLYAGPSGPHVIGKVVRSLANAMGSADPFCIDLDPRWARRLPDGSFAQERYLCHVVEQAMGVIEHQRVGVLFASPTIIEALARAMTPEQRRRIHGVHYGGMPLAGDTLERLAARDFPNAVHLSGYGNTLFGCCLELGITGPRRHLDYYPFGDRLAIELVDDAGVPVPDGEPGRVRFTRLDEGFLIVRMLERDHAHRVALPGDPPRGFARHGVRDPHTPRTETSRPTGGLY